MRPTTNHKKRRPKPGFLAEFRPAVRGAGEQRARASRVCGRLKVHPITLHFGALVYLERLLVELDLAALLDRLDPKDRTDDAKGGHPENRHRDL